MAHLFSTASRAKLAILLAVGSAVLTVSASMMSMALFTDSNSVDNNTFTTGTVDISVSPSTALFSVPAMMPGDVKNGHVTVTNGGTAQLRWTLTSSVASSTGSLETQLAVKIKSLISSACTTWDGSSPAAAGTLDTLSLTGGTLNAGASSDWCVQVSLPSGTGNTYQGKTVTATFTFAAEQTANNP